MTLPATATGHLADDDRVMLVKISPPTGLALSPDDLYEVARKWWRASITQAHLARRVLAVVDGAVAAAWEPLSWEAGSDLEETGRIAFHGVAAPDQQRWVGRPTTHLFPTGAANPVRYTTVGALLAGGAPTSAGGPTPDDAWVLLRINQSWHADITPAELYEVTRGYWVMSATKAEAVSRVLAVAEGAVREVYEPAAWFPSPVPGEEHRIGFDGSPSPERERWIGVDVSHVFPPGSQNPVRYVSAADLDDATANARPADDASATALTRGSEPELAERVNPLLDALKSDLVWSMSRAAQELFHSNTIAFLLSQHPTATASLATLLAGEVVNGQVEVWREWKHIDLVGRNTNGRGPFAVENKLYSVPYGKQLERNLEADLPWSTGHGPSGASDTSYVLLTLMDPTFKLPSPWRRVSYEQLLSALEDVNPSLIGRDADLFERYRTLVRRLVELKDAVDPRQDLDEPFSVQAALGQLHQKGFVGPLQKMRFTGLAQAVAEEYGHQLPLHVDVMRAQGLVTYERELGPTRSVGWQLQEGQLRLFVLVKNRDLAGPGAERAQARARVAEAEFADFVDFDGVADVLGDRLAPEHLEPGAWLKFAPDFVYRYRKVAHETTTRELAAALANLTAQVDAW